jgi:hypothetical protein
MNKPRGKYKLGDMMPITVEDGRRSKIRTTQGVMLWIDWLNKEAHRLQQRGREVSIRSNKKFHNHIALWANCVKEGGD